MRKSYHFRDPAHKQRALDEANMGWGKPHASWNAAAAAKRASQRMADKERDGFDLYLAKWAQHVRLTNEHFRLNLLDLLERERFGTGFDLDYGVPF